MPEMVMQIFYNAVCFFVSTTVEYQAIEHYHNSTQAEQQNRLATAGIHNKTAPK